MAELRLELRGDDQIWLSGDCDPGRYASLCGEHVRAGRIAHYVEVAAGDDEQLDGWYGLSFGRQQVYASRALGPVEPYDGPVSVRPGDLDTAVALANVIVDRAQGAPVWSNVQPRPAGERRDEWAEFLTEPGTAHFVAELDGRAIAHMALGDGNYLQVGATLPEARGRGAMHALWTSAHAWLLAHGHERCETDWRSTNPEAAGCWTALGFRPTRYRLHRLVGR